MEDEPKRSTWRTAAMWAVVLPVLYVLSAGPIIWLAKRDYISQETSGPVLDVVYAPIKWGFENSPAFHEAWKAFKDLW